MSNISVIEEEEADKHPLFQVGTFHLPGAKGDYNPVIDGIFLPNLDDNEAMQHETTHRIFSAMNKGFYALRSLAGISHALLWNLMLVINTHQGQLVGTRLEDLHPVSSGIGDGLAQTIINRLKMIETMFDICHWNLTPVAEIAAIDFQPGKDGETFDKWEPVNTDDTEEKQRRKEQLIKAVASLLKRASSWHQLQQSQYNSFDDILTKVGTIWEDYTAIEDFKTREALLHLVMNISIHSSTDNKVLIYDTLDILRENIPKAHQPNSAKLFYETLLEVDPYDSVIQMTIDYIGDLGNEEGYRGPYYLTLLVDELLGHSDPLNPNTPIDSFLQKLNSEHTAIVINPAYGLLNFVRTADGEKRCLVNHGYLSIIAQQLLPGVDNLLDSEWLPIRSDWWGRLTFYEQFRQALKTGMKVTCPFREWPGIICNEICPVRHGILFLQEHTELAGEQGLCSL